MPEVDWICPALTLIGEMNAVMCWSRCSYPTGDKNNLMSNNGR